MIAEEICLMNILPLLIAIFGNNFTVDTLVNLRRVCASLIFCLQQLMWIQFFTFTWACWFIKFSLLAFYWRLFYLYTPLTGVSDGL
jgi:hypothetical protein